jgi:predicted TIM-barrel fold metal-dependent hydrolase
VPTIPIIDSHIHLFDPSRPQGAPYSGPPSPGRTPIAAYPERYRRLAAPLGVVGAIKVEASPWIEDNLWVLEVAQRDPIIVGVVGNLEPEKPEFPEYLERCHKNPLFRGIRYGNLWGRDITKQSSNPDFTGGLKRLAEADLVMDTANPRVPLLEAVLRISDAVPALRIVIDHLPALDPAEADRAAYDAARRSS